MTLKYFSLLTILSYLFVAVAQSLRLFGWISCSRYRYYTGSLICLISHGWILYKLIETPQGQNLDWLIMLSLTLWLMNIFTCLFTFQRQTENLCVLTYPLTALSIALALNFGGLEVMNTKNTPFILFHIFISLFAMSLLSLASLQAILMGTQNYLLRHRHTLVILRILPPLQTMENLLFHIIWSGMGFLSASLLTGFFVYSNLFTPHLLPKTLLSILAWALLSALLIGRKVFGWRGPTAIRWTLSGGLLVLLSYFGTKILI